MDGTVIADAVNVASRVEGLTNFFGARVMVTDEVRAALADPSAYAMRYLGRVAVMGETRGVDDVRGDRRRSARPPGRQAGRPPTPSRGGRRIRRRRLRRAADRFRAVFGRRRRWGGALLGRRAVVLAARPAPGRRRSATRWRDTMSKRNGCWASSRWAASSGNIARCLCDAGCPQVDEPSTISTGAQARAGSPSELGTMTQRDAGISCRRHADERT